MKTKRDHFEGGLNSADYFSSANINKSKKELSSLLQSQDKDTAYYVPPEQRNNKCESAIQSEILKYLRSKGWFAVKFKSVNLVGKAGDLRLAPTDRGVPDLICCIGGSFVALEVKAAKDKPLVSSYQVRAIERIRALGGYAFVIHSVDQLEQIIKDTKMFTVKVDSPVVLTYKLYKQGYRY